MMAMFVSMLKVGSVCVKRKGSALSDAGIEVSQK